VICLDRIRMNSIRSDLPHAVRVLCNIPRASTLCDTRCIQKILPERLTESPVVGRLHDERGHIMHTQIPSEDSSKPPSAHQPSPNPIPPILHPRNREHRDLQRHFRPASTLNLVIHVGPGLSAIPTSAPHYIPSVLSNP
jgi:hypothetical protein